MKKATTARGCIIGLVAGVGLACAGVAPAAAAVHPGVQTVTAGGGQCTSNFVFRDSSDTYLGQAAHCSGTGSASSTNGCTSDSVPLGAKVTIQGASRPGTMVYNSWLTMQSVGETDPNTCEYNDFALVKLDPSDAAAVDSSVPGFGGPSGLGSAGRLGMVYSYGNSSLRAGITQLSPKVGVVLETAGKGWSRTVLTVTPGIPGDSGSGFMNATGQAIGVLSTLALAPLTGSNGVGDLGRELEYARAKSAFTTVKLVPGTRPFKANILGAILGL
jgi:hypothetical protein